MKAFPLIVAGAVIFCVGTMSAAEPADQETVKKKDNSSQAASRNGASRNQGKLMVGVDDSHAAKSGGDSHGRIVTGNDQGVWRSGKNNQKDQKKQEQADDQLMRGKKTSQTTGPIKTQQVTSSPQKLNTSAAVTTSAKPTPGATAQPIQTTSAAGGSKSSGSAQPTTTIQTTTVVGGSQSSGSAQPTIPLGGQTGAPANNTNSQTLGGLLQINPSPTP